MKTCLIITGGRLDPAFAGSFCRRNSFDRVIAVDGGLDRASSLGIIPDMAVGDFDTVSRPVLETDTELAIRKAIACGCTQITILGATGGRFDHMLANVFLLYRCLQQGVKACILDRQNKIFLIEESHTFLASRLWGKYISFLPLLGQLKGITLEGFKYPLKDYDLDAASSRCISNELSGEKGRITFREGVAICVESRD